MSRQHLRLQRGHLSAHVGAPSARAVRAQRRGEAHGGLQRFSDIQGLYDVAHLRRDDIADPEYNRTHPRGYSAADHGGRGYVDLHQAACAGNLALDGIVFLAAERAGVEKVVFASSGCVYPNGLQADPGQTVYLTEDVVAPPYDSDNLYGYAKLMAELTLVARYRERGLKAASCRYFTVSGRAASRTTPSWR